MLVLSISLVVTIAHGQARHVASETLAQVQAGLDRQQWARDGRVVRVHGMAEPCPWWGETARLRYCADQPLVLFTDPANPVAVPLPLRVRRPQPFLSALRGVPLLRGLLPHGPAIPLFQALDVTVRLESLAARDCGGRSPCYEAELLRAA